MCSETSKTEKREAISTLAGGISHDFNNLLTAIIGNIALAKRHLDQGDAAYPWLEDAEKAALRASTLTYQLLSFAEDTESVRAPVSVSDIVADACDLALGDSKVAIACELPGDLWNVEADHGQISRVIHDLLINAREAMPDGGTVTISASNLYVRRGSIQGLKRGRYVKVSVRDKGRGIPRSRLSRIFDPYFTTKELCSRKGTGLALAICQTLVKSHGGTILAESAVSSGTAVHIYLPASTLQAEENCAKDILPGVQDGLRRRWIELQRRLNSSKPAAAYSPGIPG